MYASPVWHTNRVDETIRRALRAARRKWSAAQRQHDAALAAWHRAIYDAHKNGAGVMELAEETGYKREHIRRIRVAGDEGRL